jgi:hypothetical protein
MIDEFFTNSFDLEDIVKKLVNNRSSVEDEQLLEQFAQMHALK